METIELPCRILLLMRNHRQSQSTIVYHLRLCVVMLERMQAESRKVNRMHQSPRLNRFAAYETEGSKLEAKDIISSNRGVHEPIDSSKLPGQIKTTKYLSKKLKELKQYYMMYVFMR
ncbi:hypothetical protein YC2023_107564 [Brassica napus]